MADIRMKNILACLTPAVTLLNEINDAFGTPFIQAISNTTLSLITAVQTVKRQRDECIQMMENIHGLLYAIINLHIMSETEGTLAPATLHYIGQFTETLHKIHVFVEAQQDGNRIKHFFRQSEMNTLLKNCQVGLDQAQQMFKIEGGFTTLTDVTNIQKNTETMHQKLLEMIANLSDGITSDGLSSNISSSQNSSNSFSLLPTKPKIFHGRESELTNIVDKLIQEPARIVILGAGGMGKTSLAKAALHHPNTTAKYEHRFFVACDSATTSIELADLVGSHLGLKPQKDLTKPVVQYFAKGPPSLLILDNLETPWEPVESRRGVEEFLSLLTDVLHLALIVTMRGAERPAKVRWTRPFLEPLNPLSDDAAQQTFLDITDDCSDVNEIHRLLDLTDNMPLAVDLLAHLVDYEGFSNVLTRWKTEKTSLLSSGYDRKSSLDASIALSLSSPRISCFPGAQDLLSLLAILPDGLSDVDLVQSDIPIQDLLECKAALLRTSLVYYNSKKKLMLLVPIREYIQHLHPPSSLLIHSLCRHFHLLLDLYQKYFGIYQKDPKILQITSNLGNLQQVLQLELYPQNPNIIDAIHCTISLNIFLRRSGRSHTTLMDYVPTVLPWPQDHRLEARYITELFDSSDFKYPIVDLELLIDQGKAQFLNFNDPVLEFRFYMAVAEHYHLRTNDIPLRTQSLEKALSLARSSGDAIQQSIVLSDMALLRHQLGQHHEGQRHAREAQQMAQQAANLYWEAGAVNHEAMCLERLGNLKTSVLLCQRARELLHLCGMEGSLLDDSVRMNMAEIHQLKSEYQEACNIYLEILQSLSVEQDSFKPAYPLLNIAVIDVTIGASVHTHLDKAETLFHMLGSPTGVNQCKAVLADLNIREGNTLFAENLFQQCLTAAWGIDNETVSYCLERLADTSRWNPTDMDSSCRKAVVYLGHAKQTQEKLAVYKALLYLGNIFLSEGDQDTSHNLFVVALEGFSNMDVHHSRADCMLHLGDIAKQRGDLLKAVELWKEARPLFERSLQSKDVIEVDTRLVAVDQNISDAHEKKLAHLSRLTVPATDVSPVAKDVNLLNV
ncbi:hypothetical protein C8R44DRAFT_784133 [Mycena epipterygia]|nr:hypothetical protein C8R44DRAFT_784133 [Mycena epipterygia]